MTKVFPPLLWGCSENKKMLLSAILKFLTMGRYERFSIRNAMKGIKVTDLMVLLFILFFLIFIVIDRGNDQLI